MAGRSTEQEEDLVGSFAAPQSFEQQDDRPLEGPSEQKQEVGTANSGGFCSKILTSVVEALACCLCFPFAFARRACCPDAQYRGNRPLQENLLAPETRHEDGPDPSLGT